MALHRFQHNVSGILCTFRGQQHRQAMLPQQLTHSNCKGTGNFADRVRTPSSLAGVEVPGSLKGVGML